MEDTDQRVPRTCTQTYAIVTDPQTADTVLMSTERADFVAAQSIPNLNDMSKGDKLELVHIPCTRNRRSLRKEGALRRRKQLR